MTEPSTANNATDAPVTPQNPWLMGIVSAGIALVLTGTIMVGTGGDEYSDIGFTTTQTIGSWLVGAGGTFLALWLASAAICWQIRQQR